MTAPQKPSAGAADLRMQVIMTCRALTIRSLTHGTSGNVSVRSASREFYISPSGMSYDSLQAEDIPRVDLDGRWYGRCRPSSEWRFHRDIFRSRSDVGAIVHTHSPQATALACTGRGIPAFHYMVAVAGGEDIRCAPYHGFGTQELSDAALLALQDRKACLLANHGVIAVGADAAAALALVGEVENLATQYVTALAIGDVRILNGEQMRTALEKFRTYGRQDAEDPDLVFGGNRDQP
jgi:L-fuculose-phosphate aldolase